MGAAGDNAAWALWRGGRRRVGLVEIGHAQPAPQVQALDGQPLAPQALDQAAHLAEGRLECGLRVSRVGRREARLSRRPEPVVKSHVQAALGLAVSLAHEQPRIAAGLLLGAALSALPVVRLALFLFGKEPRPAPQQPGSVGALVALALIVAAGIIGGLVSSSILDG